MMPLLAVAQDQHPATNLFGNKYFPAAKILLKDSSNVYFKKTPKADTVFRIPATDVSANLKRSSNRKL
jgi:hypothetical protein